MIPAAATRRRRDARAVHALGGAATGPAGGTGILAFGGRAWDHRTSGWAG
jgi:hypothetical protein